MKIFERELLKSDNQNLRKIINYQATKKRIVNLLILNYFIFCNSSYGNFVSQYVFRFRYLFQFSNFHFFSTPLFTKNYLCVNIGTFLCQYPQLQSQSFKRFLSGLIFEHNFFSLLDSHIHLWQRSHKLQLFHFQTYAHCQNL